MLVNGDFEQGWWRKTHTGVDYDNIFVPLGWTAWWKEGMPVPHDPENQVGYARPEMNVINLVEPFLDPPRIYSGSRAVLLFTFYRIHQAGLYQRVNVTPGQTYRFGGYAHAWSSGQDDARHSDISGDAWQNMTFSLGVDLNGGTDPWGGSVVWEAGAHIYDHYQPLLDLVFVASAPVITLFIRSEALWPFKHCDAYLDCFALDVVTIPPDPPAPVDYVVITELLPQDATLAEKWHVLQTVHVDKRTILQSADDAARLAAPGLPGSRVDVWAADRWNGDIAQYLLERGVECVEFYEFEDEPDPPAPPDPPDPNWTPRNYTPQGTKLGFHCNGAYPVDRVNRLAAAGVVLPTAKIVQAIGDLPIMVEPFVIGRMLTHGDVNLEGFDYSLGRGTPEQQAAARMAEVLPIFEPYRAFVDFIEIINEQNCPTPESHVLLAQYFIAAMQIAEDHGYRLALFSHSMGTPEASAWDIIADTGVFEWAAVGGHAISLHEYGDAAGGPDSIICRYRYLYETIILPRGLDIPLFITEYNVLPGIPYAGTVMQQWAAYDALVRQDPYVAGVHIFTLGSGSWHDYVALTVATLDEFEAYAIAQKDVING